MLQHPVLALCAALGAWAASALPLVRVAPNRLMSGEPVYLAALLPHPLWMLLALPLLAIALWPQRRSPARSANWQSSNATPAPVGAQPSGRWLLGYRSHSPRGLGSYKDNTPAAAQVFAAQGATQAGTAHAATAPVFALITVLSLALGLAGLFWLAGQHASFIAQTESRLARTSLGAGFWCLLALAWLMALDALSPWQSRPWLRGALLALLFAPSLGLLWLGVGEHLSILKEYANRSDEFWLALLRHLQIVATAIVPAVLLGWPLAWACSRHHRLRQALFPVLNLVQTIPSIALFGLLMAPLAWAATRYPGLAQAGISGVGLAPAVLALVLYSLLPLVRSALAGLEQVPGAVLTAAHAMGLTAWQIFVRVQVPLALPVLLPGLRTAVVQTIGLAAVTALVGAGGLGALMFDGLFSAANELVLLGVLPIVLLAMLADALLQAVTRLLTPAGMGETSEASAA